MDFKSKAPTEFMRAARKEKSYEMNKCLTLVHLTTNALRRKRPDTRFVLGCRGIRSEMNKCLTLVHLTSAFRIHSLGSEESKARNSGLLTNRLLRCLGICSRLV